MFANLIASLTNVPHGWAAHLSLLAQDTATNAATNGATPPAGPIPEPTFIQNFLNNPLILPVGLFLIFYLTFLGPERRRKAEEAKLMASLQKNDRVITVGGIHGTVVAVNDGIVTLRIDEGGNTRIKINRSAVSTKIVDKEKSDRD